MQEDSSYSSQENLDVSKADNSSKSADFPCSAVENSSKRDRIVRAFSLLGFSLYSVFAPHSIAGAEISLGFVGIAFVIQIVASRKLNLYRTKLDLPIALFLFWTVLSSLFSPEPGLAVPKLQSVCVAFLFYLVRSLVSRDQVVFFVVLLILSSAAGTTWSVFDLVRGRGIVIEHIDPDSPFHRTDVQVGDSIWRFDGRRIDSIAEVDRAIRTSHSGALLSIGVIRDGENAQFAGFVPTGAEQMRASPSGIYGTQTTHRFRASGWTRHYETFCETLQIVAQLSLGLALAFFVRRRKGLSGPLALLGTVVVTIGVALTAMRTAIVAEVLGAIVSVWRSKNLRIRIVGFAALSVVIASGVLIVWRTRSAGSVAFRDDSSILRSEVAIVGLRRIVIHPIFGVGMDAVHRHWQEWGFPGDVVIHLHSTPLELAFERGIPTLIFWLWIMVVWWRITSRAEKAYRESDKAELHGFLLGALGAIAGFSASSLVNYNFGDGEVALVFWFLMGLVIVVAPSEITSAQSSARPTI